MKTRNITVKPKMELVIEVGNDSGLDVQFVGTDNEVYKINFSFNQIEQLVAHQLFYNTPFEYFNLKDEFVSEFQKKNNLQIDDNQVN